MELDNLSPKALEDAAKLIEQFKAELVKTSEKVISDMYCDILPHIESDGWSNMKTQILQDLKNYSNHASKYDYKVIREQILKENRDEIIKDLNSDLLEINRQLEDEIKHLKKLLDNLRGF